LVNVQAAIAVTKMMRAIFAVNISSGKPVKMAIKMPKTTKKPMYLLEKVFIFYEYVDHLAAKVGIF
jgi:hypothetical protein